MGKIRELGEAAVEALALARSVHDPAAEADSQALHGRVLESQGKLDDSKTAYEEALAISRRLADLDPSNAGWQGCNRSGATGFSPFPLVFVHDPA